MFRPFSRLIRKVSGSLRRPSPYTSQATADWIAREKIADAFDRIVISAEVGVTKPKAEIYLLALQQLEVSPSEAVFVDDFIENVEGARAVGMSAIHFRDPESALDELKHLLKM